MCEPDTVNGALALLDRALDYLNAADLASLPVDTQAAALKRLERAGAKQTAARTALLSAFTAGGGPEADGHGVARTWLRWQTRITRGAAAGAVAWMRRLAAHPVIERALARGEISASWARELCAWTGRLPEGVRDDADRLLCQAAAGGADLEDLGRLAEAIYQRTAPSTAAQPGLRSPCARPAPENVMPRWKFRSPNPPSSRSSPGPRVRW